MGNTNTKKEYNDVGFWETQNGGAYTATLTEFVVERLRRILTLAEKNGGGKIYFGPIREEYQKEGGPSYRMDYLPPKDNAEANAGL